MSEVLIRPVQKADIATLRQIYAYYVEKTAITFEYKVPTLPEFTERIEQITAMYPYLVAVKDNVVVGFAYAASFNHREAYKWAVEVTVYLDHASRGGGIGKKLYQALEKKLKSQGIQNINACISVPATNEQAYVDYASMHFHEHLGYRLVGRFHSCGYKFDTWYDMVWMEKFIGTHPVPAPPLDKPKF